MKPIHTAQIGTNFCTTVRPKGYQYAVSYEHVLLGNRELSVHDTEREAILEADTQAMKAARIIPMAVEHLGRKLESEGVSLAGVGPEKALEMVEKGEVSL